MTMLTAHRSPLTTATFSKTNMFIPSRDVAATFLPTIREIFNSDTRYQVHVSHYSYDLLIIQKRPHQYQHAASITCIQHTHRANFSLATIFLFEYRVMKQRLNKYTIIKRYTFCQLNQIKSNQKLFC